MKLIHVLLAASAAPSIATSSLLRGFASSGAMADLQNPAQALLPGMGTVHPAVAQTIATQPFKTAPVPDSTPDNYKSGIGPSTNSGLMALPKGGEKDKNTSPTHLLSSHTTPGLPVWQEGPKFTPVNY